MLAGTLAGASGAIGLMVGLFAEQRLTGTTDRM
jgi:hypothetical protein